MKNKILAIDPGINGGLALLSDDDLLLWRMPVVMVNKKNRIDLAALSVLINSCSPGEAIIEQQQSMPGQGVSSCFRLGLNYGLLLGVLHTLKIPTTEVRAATWKKRLGVPADKDAARHRATQLLPSYSNNFAKKCDDGLAEAALMAYYAMKLDEAA